MTCVHLRKLYQLCQQEDLRLSGTDLVRIVCRQCGEQEVCPSTLIDEYDAETQDRPAETPSAAIHPGTSPGSRSEKS